MSSILYFLLRLIFAVLRAYVTIFLVLLLARGVNVLFFGGRYGDDEHPDEGIVWTPLRRKVFFIAWLVLTLYHLIF